MTTYYAVTGSGFTDKDAEIIGPEIHRLEKAGRSKTRDIAEAARDKQSPLHKYVYDCTRTEAANRYYIANAGRVIRSIQVEVVTKRMDGSERVPHRMRAYYPVHLDNRDDEEDDGRERHYVSMTTVLSNVDYSTQVWREGLRHLQLFRSRFRDYDDVFGEVIRAIDAAEQRLTQGEVA